VRVGKTRSVGFFPGTRSQAYGRPPVSIETTGEPTTIVFQTAALAQVVEAGIEGEEPE